LLELSFCKTSFRFGAAATAASLCSRVDLKAALTEAHVLNALVESSSVCTEVEDSSIHPEAKGDPGTTQPCDLKRTYKPRFNPASFTYRVAKRWIDLTLCCVFIPVIAPIFLIIALAIRLTSPGPVFYVEKRVGQFGKRFTIFKFRSMYTKEYLRDVLQHKECEATLFKMRVDCKHVHDPRITPVGRILRKLSLDELPQLINVLRGDMSLVGPRPVVDFELERYGDYVHCYTLMVPGMSGLWQISGRNDVSYERRVSIDAQYCLSWSPWLDMQILARTIPAVARCTGAY
jgi:exopolysaccharide production protein ExoY